MAVYYTGSLTGRKNESSAELEATELSLKLDDLANNWLKANGGYVIKNDIMIARTMHGTYVAVTLICSHRNVKKLLLKRMMSFIALYSVVDLTKWERA